MYKNIKRYQKYKKYKSWQQLSVRQKIEFLVVILALHNNKTLNKK